MTDGLSSGSNVSEHDVTRVMAGNVESIRARLVMALEQLGYRVTSENPLRARHNARGAASYFMSVNALEYSTRLDISLKPQGQGATQITFDYQVQHGFFTKGDYQTLTREAEAILALAAHRAQVLDCAGCGAEIAADSRFCRKCGAPIRASQPAELEVMRLTAGTRAGYQWAWTGIIFLFLAWFFPILAVMKSSPKPMIIWAIFSALGAWALGAGLRRTHLTINPKQDKEEMRLSTHNANALPSPITNELPPQTSYRSVTEGTTDLLPILNEAEPVRLPRRNERSQA